MALSPTAVQDTAQAILGCVCQALDVAAAAIEGQPGCPTCRSCVVPGLVAWDSCDDPCDNAGGQGQLTVSMGRMYPSSKGAFPAEERQVIGVNGCAVPQFTALELIVTLLRCAPGPNEQGCPPSCEELTTAAGILHADAVTVYNALLCCFPETSGRRRGQMFVVGQQRPVGPQGGCVGIEQRITVALPHCLCPQIEP